MIMLKRGSICIPSGREPVSSLVENAISGTSMGSLIFRPSGDGESNMIHMTLPVIATMYLDKTNKWETVGLEKRNEALQHIKVGRLHVFFPFFLLTNPTLHLGLLKHASSRLNTSP